MKRIAILFLTLVLLLGGCAVPQAEKGSEAAQPTMSIHAVWLTCYELNAMLKEPGEAAFRASFEQTAAKCAAGGVDVLFVQVRPFCDAFYPSALFDWSDLCVDQNKEKPTFDPLAVMVEAAHAQGLQFHAWVNPYRVSFKSDTLPEKLTTYQSCVGQTESGTYFDPSKTAVRRLIWDGMREILQNYEVDGIHMDDYFYPTAEERFDRDSYAEACALGSKKSLADWRREQVDLLLRGAYELVKSFGDDKIFSVSPACDIEKDRGQSFADVEKWLANSGYADWLIPQIYFGFDHETMPFASLLQRWGSLPRHQSVRLLCGLAAYKQGKEDQFAGTGRDEWKNNNDVLTRQMNAVAADGQWSGYCLFSYGYCGF